MNKTLINQANSMAASLTSKFSSLTMKMEKQLHILSEKERTWLELENKMENRISKVPNKIKLDVGGRMFSVSKSTLMSIPDT